MTKIHPLKSTLALFAAGALLVAGGCSDGTTLDAPSSNVQTFNESGRLLQAPVYGATVCADLNANDACDPDEPTTTSGADGRYVLPPFEGAASLEYRVLSRGGMTTNGDGDEIPGQDMAAVPGAKVMSMLTTLEAYTPKADRPALVAQLNALAGPGVTDYRTLDFVDTAVQPGLMLAVKTVEAVMATFSQIGVSSPLEQQLVLSDLGTTIAKAPVLTADTVRTALPALVSAAASTTVNTLTSPPNANLVVIDAAAFSTSMNTLVTALATAIPITPVKETPGLLQDVASSTLAPTQTLTQAVSLVRSLELASITLTTNSNPQTWSAAALPGTLTLATLPSSLQVTVAGSNSGADITYADVLLTLTISDNTTGRNIVLSIGGLSVGIANGGALTLSKGTQALAVSGRTSTGVVVNANVADTSWGTVSGGQVTFDLAALNNQLQLNGGRNLNTLASSGRYSISAKVSGPTNPPFVPMTRVLDLVIQ